MTHPTTPRSGRALSRRSLLSGLSLGLGAAAIAPRLSLRRAFAAAADAPFLVIVNQFGGNDSLNTYVPHGLGAYYDARPRIAIAPEEVLPFVPGEGFHPALAPLHARFQAGQGAVVRQVGYPDPNLSHFESADVWSKGARLSASQRDPRGWIGRAADLYFPGALDVVGVRTGRRSDFVADTAKPLLLDGLGSYGPGERAVPWWERPRRDAAVKAMLAAGTSAQEASPGKELRRSLANAYDLVEVVRQADADYTSAVAYPGEALSEPLRDVAKLVKAGLGGRIFYTGSGGYDTHSDQRGQHAGLLGGLAASLAAFADDLEAMGAWNRAAILVISEFGRRNYDNASAGTDHGHGLSVLALGGAIRGGAYGPAFTPATISQNEEMPGAVDFRAVYSNVLERHLGVDPAPVFTEAWSGDQRVPLF